MSLRTLCIAISLLVLGAGHAADNPPPPPAPAPASTPPAAAPAPRAPAAPVASAPNTTVDGLSPRIDAWFQGTLLSVDAEHSTFTVHGGNMPYATAYAKMLREMHDKTANIDDAEQRRRIEGDIHDAWQARLSDARAKQPEPRGSDMHYQLPARGTVMMLNEGDSGGLGFLNYDRGLEERASNVDAGKPDTISSLRDFKIGDRVMVGYASDSPDRNMPEAYAIVRERAGTQPSAERQAYPPTAMESQPVEQTRTTTVYEERTDRDPVSNAGHTIKGGLEKGANKIKHFFGGGD